MSWVATLEHAGSPALVLKRAEEASTRLRALAWIGGWWFAGRAVIVATALVVHRFGPSGWIRLVEHTHVLGPLQAWDARWYRMVAGSGGWVKQITSKVAGTFVQKGDLLAVYYGRDFQTPEMTYIFVVRNKEKAEKTGAAATVGAAGAAATSAADFQWAFLHVCTFAQPN